jgi:phosphatidate cytidylyltransferase
MAEAATNNLLGLRRRANPDHTADKSAGSIDRCDSTASETDPPPPPPPRNSESKPMKILTRAISGLIMITCFVGILLSGHLYVCTFVGVLQILLFRELVTVRYAAHFDRIEQTIPLFRTTQWMWFFTSLFYTYSEFVVEVLIKSNISLHGFIDYAQLAPALSFLLYTATFVVTIATFQPGHIRFQLNQLCWTIVVLCLTVGQLKYIMHNGEKWMDSLVFLCVVSLRLTSYNF